MMTLFCSRAAPWILLLAVDTLVFGAAAGERSSDATSDARMAYYQARLRDDPGHYPSQALLGAACFDKAQETLDPKWLAEARSALMRSLEIQPNFPALKLLAATCNYRHRFAEALDWIDRAAKASPGDASLVAMRVEADLALGQIAEARKLVENSSDTDNDFYRTAARGHVLLAEGHRDQAIEAFLKASEIAERQKATSLAVWAKVRAAGVRIDGGEADRASPYLEAAGKLDANDRFLRIHQVEVLEAAEQYEAALTAYEALLAEQADPELHHRAYLLATRLSRRADARRHFDAAEKLLRAPLAAGEVYYLEGLATLYCDAGVRLDEARTLAERNLQYKRDQSAVDLARRAKELSGAK